MARLGPARHGKARQGMAGRMKDGGSAFPLLEAIYDYDDNFIGMENISDGMTIRDWFAGRAPAASGYAWRLDKKSKVKRLAELAYEIADAMLAAREGRR